MQAALSRLSSLFRYSTERDSSSRATVQEYPYASLPLDDLSVGGTSRVRSRQRMQHSDHESDAGRDIEIVEDGDSEGLDGSYEGPYTVEELEKVDDVEKASVQYTGVCFVYSFLIHLAV